MKSNENVSLDGANRLLNPLHEKNHMKNNKMSASSQTLHGVNGTLNPSPAVAHFEALS